MVLSFLKQFIVPSTKDFKFHLAFFWSLFLSFGFHIGVFSAPKLIDNTLSYVSGYVYFVVLFFVCSILMVTLIFRHRPRCLLGFASIWAYCYGFVFGVIAGCFGRAGWLVVLVLNFVGIFCSISEIWFWLTDFTQFNRRNLIFISLIFIGVFTMVFAFELLVLVPACMELLIIFN